MTPILSPERSVAERGRPRSGPHRASRLYRGLDDLLHRRDDLGHASRVATQLLEGLRWTA